MTQTTYIEDISSYLDRHRETTLSLSEFLWFSGFLKALSPKLEAILVVLWSSFGILDTVVIYVGKCTSHICFHMVNPSLLATSLMVHLWHGALIINSMLLCFSTMPRSECKCQWALEEAYDKEKAWSWTRFPGGWGELVLSRQPREATAWECDPRMEMSRMLLSVKSVWRGKKYTWPYGYVGITSFQKACDIQGGSLFPRCIQMLWMDLHNARRR